MAIGASLSRRDQMLVSLCVLSLAIGVGYAWLIHMPKHHRLREMEGHVVTLRGRNEAAQRNLSSASVAKLREQSQAYEQTLAVLKQLVPSASEVPAVLEKVSTSANLTGVELTAVEPMPVLAGQQLDTYRYKLSVKGGYHAVARFLTAVGSLDRIVAPVALDMKYSGGPDSAATREQRVEAAIDTDLQLLTYVIRSAAATDGVAPTIRDH